MEKILSQLKLSNESIKIYLASLGKSILTYQELKTILPELKEEEFKNNLNELLRIGLLIQTNIEKDIILTEFLTIPPYNPIIDYFKNIEASFSEIRNALNDLIVNSINDIFINDDKIELDSIFNQYKEIRKDFLEDSLLQKKDAEDISKQMDAISKVGEIMLEIQDMIKAVSQSQFASLGKTFVKLKDELKQKIGNIEIKKKKEDLLFDLLEEIFKDKLNNVIKDFISKINSTIKDEFNRIPFNEIIDNAINSRDDFKMLLMNLLSSSELNMNKISELVETKKKNLDKNKVDLKNKIIGKLNAIILKSIKQIESLNNPIINLISEAKIKVTSINDSKKDKVQPINSIAKMKKNLLAAIKNSKEELLIIVPKLDDYLELKLIKKIPKSTRIRIASSDPHVNSKVKKFKEIKNLEFKNYENQNFIGIKSDNDLIALGIVRNNQDPLDNFTGFLSNNIVLINLLKSSLYNIWSGAEREIGTTIRERPTYVPSKISDETFSQEEKQVITKQPLDVSSATEDLNVFNAYKEKLDKVDTQNIITEPSENEQLKFISRVNPKAGNSAGMVINDVFNTLIQNINNYTGEILAQDLEKIADLILEKLGFSVTLHNIRRAINDHKNQKIMLTIEQKNEIFKSIEDWKQRLFT